MSGLHFSDDAFENRFESAFQCLLRYVDESDRAIHCGTVEKIELLLITKHLERRLAKHSKIECGALNGREREHHLVGQRRLAATGRTRNQIEGELRYPTAQYRIEPGYPSRQTINSDFAIHRFRDLAIGVRQSLLEQMPAIVRTAPGRSN